MHRESGPQDLGNTDKGKGKTDADWFSSVARNTPPNLVLGQAMRV